MSLSVLRGFQFLIPLITLPYLVRTIGMENFGLVNFSLSLGMYFGAIIQFGFGITATREIARHRNDLSKLAQIYSATLTASVILALISAVLFILIVLTVEKFNAYLNLYLFTLAFVVFQSLFPIWFFQGIEKMKYIAFLSMGTSLMFLISLFLFVKREEDFFLVPLLQAIAAMITFVLTIVVIHKQFKINFKIPHWTEVKTIYQEGWYAFVSQLAPNLYNNSAVFLLGMFTNNIAVGLYTAATTIIGAAVSFGYILSNTFLPYLSRGLNQHKLFQVVMLGSGSLLTLIIFMFSGNITDFLFSVAGQEVAIYVQWLSFSILFTFAYLTYNTNYLMLNGNERIAKNISLYVSLFSFFNAIVLICFYGVYGAIGSILIARFLMAYLSFWFYKKKD